MPVDVSEIVRKEREHYKAMQEDERVREKREAEKRKKEKEESEKNRIERESHSEEYRQLQIVKFNKTT